MIYATSDIHGCVDELKERMKLVDLSGNNKMVFLGDYIDYGPASGQVLKFLNDLQQKYGNDKVIVLKGNHEQMFLDWIDEYSNPYPDGTEEYLTHNDWLRTDFESGEDTISSFLSESQMEHLKHMSETCSLESTCREAVRMILTAHEDMIGWIRRMPFYYETEIQIFVHAGVNEKAEEYWELDTTDGILLGKYPPTKGKFYKTVIAGHIGTGTIVDDRSFHEIFFDGMSHYYIDGSVYEGGKLLILGYDENDGKYYQIEEQEMMPVVAYK